MKYKKYYFLIFVLLKLITKFFNINVGILNFNNLFIFASTGLGRYRSNSWKDNVNTKKNKQFIEYIKKKYGGENKKEENNKSKDNKVNKESDL